MVANAGFEQVELTPLKATGAAGGDPVLVAPKPEKVQALNHLEETDEFEVHQTTEKADPDEPAARNRREDPPA